jgi:hypothetical protein
MEMKNPLAAWRHTAGSPAPPPLPDDAARVSFDPRDGRRRVLITVEADGTFAPVAWYGVPRGLCEASNIAAHGALILTECIWRASVEAAPDGE